MSSRICFWIVTSSAVVGSSAMSSLGSQAIAIAIITRCCWPPDICDGKESMRRSGSGMPTSASTSIARLRACAPVMPHVQPQHFLDLEADGEHRVERRHRLLEDHRDVGAAQVLQLAARQRREVAPAVDDLAVRIDDRVLGRQQAEDRKRGDRLAGARLAHQRDGRCCAGCRRRCPSPRRTWCAGRGGTTTRRSRTRTSGSTVAGVGGHVSVP